jgi:hypothetical protein
MRVLLHLILLWLLGACFSARLAAEVPLWYVGGRVGYVELEEVDDDGSFNFGVMGGLFAASRLAIEASIDFQESEFPIPVTEDLVITTAYIERETTALQAGVSFMPFPDQQLRPYVLGGVGYYFSSYSGGGFPDETVSDSGYFAGLGLEMFGGAWDGDAALVLEGRWLFTQKEGYADESVQPDGYTVSIGFRVKFGP